MKIITSVVNTPDFITVQYYSLRTFIGCPIEYIVFNDAKDFPDTTNDGDVQMRDKINTKCRELGVQCICVNNAHHQHMLNASTRHSDTFNTAIRAYYLANPDKYLLIDSDMFLIDHLNISKYEQYDSAIVLQTRGTFLYIWPGLCYFDFTKITDGHLLDWRCCPGADTGANTNKWLQTQMYKTSKCTKPTPSIYLMSQLISQKWNLRQLPITIPNYTEISIFLQTDCRNVNNTFFCELYDGVFLHYRGVSNWMGNGLKQNNNDASDLVRILVPSINR